MMQVFVPFNDDSLDDPLGAGYTLVPYQCLIPLYHPIKYVPNAINPNTSESACIHDSDCDFSCLHLGKRAV